VTYSTFVVRKFQVLESRFKVKWKHAPEDISGGSRLPFVHLGGEGNPHVPAALSARFLRDQNEASSNHGTVSYSATMGLFLSPCPYFVFKLVSVGYSRPCGQCSKTILAQKGPYGFFDERNLSQIFSHRDDDVDTRSNSCERYELNHPLPAHTCDNC